MSTSSEPEKAKSLEELTAQGKKRFNSLVEVLSELMLIAGSFPETREGIQKVVNTLLDDVLTIHPILAVVAIDSATKVVLEAITNVVSKEVADEVIKGIDLSKINLDKSKPN